MLSFAQEGRIVEEIQRIRFSKTNESHTQGS